MIAVEPAQKRVEQAFPGIGALNREDRIEFLLKQMGQSLDDLARRLA